MVNGSEIYLDNKHKAEIYRLKAHGQSLAILSYGARLLEWLVPCEKTEAKTLNLVLNHANLQNYIADPAYMGAVVGPIPNRLKNAEYYLSGQKYSLKANEGANCLHSSNFAFSELDFALREIGEDFLLLEHVFIPEETLTGGNQCLQIKFILQTCETKCRLRIEYNFSSTVDTLCNITNHSYFKLWNKELLDQHNLSAEAALANLQVTLPSEFYTPTDENLLVTGEVKPVSEAPLFDFRKGQTLEAGLAALYSTKASGYDHNFILERDYQHYDAKSGHYFAKPAVFKFVPANFELSFCSTEAAAQFYTANYLACDKTNTGEEYAKQTAFCFECQAIPNSPSFSHLSALKLRAGEQYNTVTEITFRAN